MKVELLFLSVSSAALCFVYVTVLSIFSYSVFENDNIISSFREICFSASLVALGMVSTSLSTSAATLIQLGVFFLSYYFAYKINRCYVAGVRYTSVNLDGKVYIITGSNTGLGFETAKQIASMGGTIILACRSVEKAKAAKEIILAATTCSVTKVIVLKLDLCGFDSVRKFVKEFRLLNLPLHGLINNAGVMQNDRTLTQDGFEMVFTANHLSHFLLTNLLLPELELTKGRVVNVTSSLHKSLREFNFDDVMSERSYSLFGTYAQSKLANIMFTFELQKRYVLNKLNPVHFNVHLFFIFCSYLSCILPRQSNTLCVQRPNFLLYSHCR